MPVGHGLIISLLLIACMPVANAAPNIPLGEMPGRERERFNPSPVDRFTDPFAWPGQAEPLYRWCNGKPRRAKRKQEAGAGLLMLKGCGSPCHSATMVLVLDHGSAAALSNSELTSRYTSIQSSDRRSASRAI